VSNFSDISTIEQLMYSVPGGKLDVQALLSERKMAQRFEVDVADSSYPECQVESTAKALKHQVDEKAFVLTPEPRRAPVIREFKIEQEYEGTVVAINLHDRTFTARLADITGNDADEEGEFSLDELNGDENLVVPGALFTWTIGLQLRGPTYQRSRVSDIRFRRLPPATKELIAKVEKEAEEMSVFLRQTEIADPIIDTL
jgi:hypothetical protein